MITYLLLFALALCAVHLIFNYNKTARQIKKIPGPRDVFIVGNAIEINVSPVELFKLGRKYVKKWKGIFRLWSYPFGFVCLYNPEDIEVVISTMRHNDKSFVYKFLKPWLKNGLLLSSGATWQQRRKILTPAFHFNILQRFYVIFEENSGRLVDNLNKLVGQPVDIIPILSEFTLSSICETAMGTQFNKDSSEYGKSYKDTIYKIGGIIVQRFVKIHLYFDFIFNLSKYGRDQKKYLSIIRKFTTKVIKEREMNFSENNTDSLDDECKDLYMGNKKKNTAMLDLLLSAKKERLIDDEGIQEEVDTFMFEGHDTTAAGLIFFLMLIANNQHAQDKIVAELREVLGDLKKRVTIDDLCKMRYLECCIKESLRLYPPVPLISRDLNEPVQLSNYTVPAGSICLIQIYDLHRREDLYENPDKFDPDRFLPENCKNRHPYAYIPFSAGPRNCIGQKFAILEIKSAAAAILSNYLVLPVTRPEDVEIASDLVLRNNGPVSVTFVKRID